MNSRLCGLRVHISGGECDAFLCVLGDFLREILDSGARRGGGIPSTEIVGINTGECI